MRKRFTIIKEIFIKNFHKRRNINFFQWYTTIKTIIWKFCYLIWMKFRKVDHELLPPFRNCLLQKKRGYCYWKISYKMSFFQSTKQLSIFILPILQYAIFEDCYIKYSKSCTFAIYLRNRYNISYIYIKIEKFWLKNNFILNNSIKHIYLSLFKKKKEKKRWETFLFNLVFKPFYVIHNISHICAFNQNFSIQNSVN